jgi:hypothetical protein
VQQQQLLAPSIEPEFTLTFHDPTTFARSSSALLPACFEPFSFSDLPIRHFWLFFCVNSSL